MALEKIIEVINKPAWNILRTPLQRKYEISYDELLVLENEFQQQEHFKKEFRKENTTHMSAGKYFNHLDSYISAQKGPKELIGEYN